MKKFLRGLFSLVLQLLLLGQPSVQFVLAAETSSTTSDTSASSTVTPTPVNLDLTSTAKSLSPGNLVTGSSSVAINVAGAVQNITSSTILTPAEYLAVYQIANTGQQTIQLGANGNAVGGTFTMGQSFSQAVANLVIPNGVTAIHDFGTASNLNLAGNFTNAGNFYAISSNSQIVNAAISAANIFNQSGALLSSVLPSSGLSGVNAAVSNLNLSLSALNSIVNAGTIASAGNLSVSATNLTNSGIITAAGNAAFNINNVLQNMAGAQIVAQQAMNVNVSTLVNSGLMSAMAGNLAIANAAQNSLLSINNQAGTLSALAGELSVNSPKGMNLLGGTLEGQSVKLTAPEGEILTDVGRISGPLSVKADAAHLFVQSGGLNLASLDVSGDPITAVNGPLTLPALVATDGVPATFISDESIFGAAGTGTDVNTTHAGGAGGPATFLAGVNWSEDPVTHAITVTGPSGLGGDISGINSVVTSGAGAGNNAGDITFGAYGANPLFGFVFSGGTIDVGDLTADSVNGQAGRVLVYGSSNSLAFQAIRVGAISSQGLHNAGPSTTIDIRTDAPDLGAGVTFNSTGLLTAGTIGASTTSYQGNISVGNINTISSLPGGGGVSIQIGNLLTFGGVTTGSITTYGGAPGTFAPSLWSGGAVSVFANGTVFVNGNINAGASLTITSPFGDAVNIGTGAPVILTSGGAITINASSGIAPFVAVDNGQLNIGNGSSMQSDTNILLNVSPGGNRGVLNIGSSATIISGGFTSMNVSQGGLQGAINVGSNARVTSGGLLEMNASFNTALPAGCCSSGSIVFGSNSQTTGSTVRVTSSFQDNNGFIQVQPGASISSSGQISLVASAYGNNGQIIIGYNLVGGPRVPPATLVDPGILTQVISSGQLQVDASPFGSNGTVYISPSSVVKSLQAGGTIITASIGGSGGVINNAGLIAGLEAFVFGSGGVINAGQINADGLAAIYGGNYVLMTNGAMVSGGNGSFIATDNSFTNFSGTMVYQNDQRYDRTTGFNIVFTGGINGRNYTQGVLDAVSREVSALGERSQQSQQSPEMDPIIHVDKGHSNIMMFTTTNQVMSGQFGGENTCLRGSAGTTLSTDGGILVLHAGQLHADSGGTPASITTERCSVNIDPNSAAVVEVEPGKKVHVMALASTEGVDRSAVTVKLGDSSEESIELKPGEEVIVGDKSLADEDLIPTDGIGRTVVSGGIMSQQRMVKTEFALDQYFGDKVLPAVRSLRLSGSRKAGQQRMVSHIAQSVQSKYPGYKLPSDTFNAIKEGGQAGEPIHLIAAEGTEFQHTGDDKIKLFVGSMLLNTPENTSVETPCGNVTSKPGAISDIEFNKGSLRVKACSGPGDTSIAVGGGKVDILPGEEVLLADHKPTGVEARPFDGIGRRNGNSYGVTAKLHAHISEFSIVSMLKSYPYLQALRNASSQEDKVLQERILKTAAMVHQVSAHRGPYTAPVRSSSNNIPAACQPVVGM